MRKIIAQSIIVTFLTFIHSIAFAGEGEGGVSIQGTRVVYPKDVKQISLSVINSSAKKSFLVQSWIEDASGNHSQDLITTPPLYLSLPGAENKLRLMLLNDTTPNNREKLYYFITKIIPSVNDLGDSDKAVLRIATANRIKLFIRPSGLSPTRENADSMLTFNRLKNDIKVNNPTPYYITLTDIKVGGKATKSTMISPFGSVLIRVERFGKANISYRTIDDYGSLTKSIVVNLK